MDRLKDYGFTTKIIRHPGYNEYTLENDIALVKLPNPAKDIPVAKLPPKSVEKLNFLGLSVVTTGYGETESGDYSKHLLKATIKLTAHDKCKGITGPGVNIKVDERIFCAASADHAGACDGDSGGPLTMTHKGKLYLLGVNSFADRIDCRKVMRNGFTSVLKFKKWIWSVVKKN